MILATDVHYAANHATAAGVAFKNWSDPQPTALYTTQVSPIAAYEPGSFYKRELPCLLALLQDHQLQPSLIVVDGFVFLDEQGRAGLGKHLYDALNQQIPIIGVAKTRFHGIGPAHELCRGNSQSPLFVTSVGIDLTTAKQHTASMHGTFRFPTLLKQVDQLCRGLISA